MLSNHELRGQLGLGNRVSGFLPFLRLESFRKSGRLSVVMTTTCMSPLVKKGDMCEVRCLSLPLGEGDLFLFLRGQTFILHRFRGRRLGKTFLHQGDLDILPDDSHCNDIVIGRVVTISRGNCVLELDHYWFKVLSRISVRITRLESVLMKAVASFKTGVLKRVLILVHRMWNTIIWLLYWQLCGGAMKK